MFLKHYLIKLFSRVQTQIQQRGISIQLATPRTIATFMLGYHLYIRYIDHQVRKQIASQNKSQKLLMSMFMKSWSKGSFLQGIGLFSCLLSSYFGYTYTNNPLWIIVGGGLSFIVYGLQRFILNPVNQQLLQLQLQNIKKPSQKNNMQITQKRFQLLRKYKQVSNYKICIYTLSVLLFFIAESKYSQKIDINLAMKK